MITCGPNPRNPRSQEIRQGTSSKSKEEGTTLKATRSPHLPKKPHSKRNWRSRSLRQRLNRRHGRIFNPPMWSPPALRSRRCLSICRPCSIDSRRSKCFRPPRRSVRPTPCPHRSWKSTCPTLVSCRHHSNLRRRGTRARTRVVLSLAREAAGRGKGRTPGTPAAVPAPITLALRKGSSLKSYSKSANCQPSTPLTALYP
jgi:hypothetical protein